MRTHIQLIRQLAFENPQMIVNIGTRDDLIAMVPNMTITISGFTPGEWEALREDIGILQRLGALNQWLQQAVRITSQVREAPRPIEEKVMIDKIDERALMLVSRGCEGFNGTELVLKFNSELTISLEVLRHATTQGAIMLVHPLDGPQVTLAFFKAEPIIVNDLWPGAHAPEQP